MRGATIVAAMVVTGLGLALVAPAQPTAAHFGDEPNANGDCPDKGNHVHIDRDPESPYAILQNSCWTIDDDQRICVGSICVITDP